MQEYILLLHGEEIGRGNAVELAERIGKSVETFYQMANRNYATREGYSVDKVVTPDKVDKRYESIKKHLLQYGNTVVRSDVERIAERLHEDGIDCAMRKIRDEDGIYYVLEVRCKTRELKHSRTS